MSKAEKVLAYIRQNGSISMQKVMEIGNYRSRTGARKLIDKMINADFIEKTGEGNKTIYKIKERAECPAPAAAGLPPCTTELT